MPPTASAADGRDQVIALPVLTPTAGPRASRSRGQGLTDASHIGGADARAACGPRLSPALRLYVLAVYETEVNRRPITRQVLASLVHLLESEGIRKAPKLGPAMERICYQVGHRLHRRPRSAGWRCVPNRTMVCAGTPVSPDSLGGPPLLSLCGSKQHGVDARAPPPRGRRAVLDAAAVPPLGDCPVRGGQHVC